MSTPVTLVGRLTADPELRFGANGTAVARFAVVTSRRVRDQQTGEWSDADTSFWDCVAFKQTAENVAESLVKGLSVIVVGKAAQRTWETKEGEKRRSVEVVVDEVGPSLRNATAKVEKAQRQGSGQGGGFGQQPQQTGQQQGGGFGNQGGGAPAEDPWATGGGGFGDDPPF